MVAHVWGAAQEVRATSAHVGVGNHGPCACRMCLRRQRGANAVHSDVNWNVCSATRRAQAATTAGNAVEALARGYPTDRLDDFGGVWGSTAIEETHRDCVEDVRAMCAQRGIVGRREGAQETTTEQLCPRLC